MKFYIRILIVGLALDLLYTSGYSQTSNSVKDTLKLSLSDAWQKADDHSRLVKVKKIEVHLSEEEVKDAKLERLPEIGVMGSFEKASNIPVYDNGLFSEPSQHEVIHTLYHIGSDLYLNLYNGHKTKLKIDEVKLSRNIAMIQKDQAFSDIHYKTASLYLELQKSLIFKTLILKDIADQEKQLKEVIAFHKNGTILKSDILRVELELSKRKMALVTIDNDILIANQKLNIVLGEPDDRVIQPLNANFENENIPTYEQYLEKALLHSFPYHISEQRTALSKLKIDQVKANVSPKVGLYSDFYYANPQIFLFPYNPSWYSLGVVGLKVSFPVSQIYHNIHKVRAAKLEYEKEEELHKDTEDKVRQHVKEAYLRFQEAIVQIGVARVNVDQAVENARIIKNTYFNQTSLITDLLDADVNVIRSRFELAAAAILAQDRYYLLENITGTL